jgi:hypothetical protein
MNFFLFRSNWDILYREVWLPLSKSASAPPDMFIELFRYASTKLGFEPEIEAFNDPKLAKEEFRKVSTPTDEKTCLSLLEGFYDILSTFNTDINKKYYSKLKEFIERHNLRYSLTPDCKIRLSLTGLLISQYATLKKAIAANQLRAQCLQSLELNIGRINEDTVEETCITRASNLLEGITIDKTTNRKRTFGEAIEGCRDCFPHEALIESAKKFYRFFSDYPNLRHASTIDKKIRDLKKDDAILSISFAVLFAAYIADNNASQAILSGDL